MRRKHQPIPHYFLEDTDTPGFFMHFIGGTEYQLRKGVVGAAMYPLPIAQDFIQYIKASNLKPVLCEDAIKAQLNNRN